MAKKAVISDKDLGLKQVLAEARQYSNVAVTVGVHQGNYNKESGLDIAEYAAYNEFGTSKIPGRSFMRSTFDENENRYTRIFANGIKQLGANATLGRVLTFAGENVATDIKEKIRSGIAPANSPRTIAIKKSDKTLIDTGGLVGSITYEITKK